MRSSPLAPLRRFAAVLPRRLSWQIVVGGLVFSLPAIVLSAWLLSAISSALIDSAQATARAVATHTLDALDRVIFERYGDALVFSQLPAVRRWDRAHLDALTSLLVATYTPYYRLALVVDQHGQILSVNRSDSAGRPIATGELVGRSVAGQTWFEGAKRAAQPVLVEDFHLDALVQEVYGDGRFVMSFSAPIRNEAGQVVGVWSTRMAREPLADLLSVVSARYAMAHVLPVVVRDRQGQELMSAGPQLASSAVRLASVRSTGFSSHPGLGWSLDVYQPRGVIDQRQMIVAAAIGLVLLVAGGSLGMLWFLRWRVLIPLGRIAQQVRRLGQGEAAVMDTTLMERTDELGGLAHAVQSTARHIEAHLGQLRDLHAVSRALQRVHVLDLTPASLEQFLRQVLDTAVRLTGARYGAVGVFHENGSELSHFFVAGMDKETQRAIGSEPSGRGLLGFLAYEQDVLRLKDLTAHPAFSGFPLHHPPMRSFLGVSIWVRGRLLGRLYLTEKQGAEEFSEFDAAIMAILASQAGTAIEDFQFVHKLQAAEAKHRALLESTGEGIVGLDMEGKCTFINRAGAAMLGYKPEEVVGENLHALAHHTRPDGSPYPTADCPIHNAFRKGQTCQVGDELLWRRDGTCFPAELTCFPLRDQDGAVGGAVATFTDITTRKRAEEAIRDRDEQLRQSQKMEAIGRLAGGIAHDFNNILTVIQGYSELLLARQTLGEKDRTGLQEIQNAARRASALTNQMLAFSRRQVLQPKVLNLNALVANTERMLRRLIGEHIRLVTNLEPDLGPIRADPGQIEQVIVNLAVNARDAMPDGGTLTIASANVDLTGAFVESHRGSQPGPHVRLSVTDTGVGMDPATRAHIFEPFFTTKSPGKGTGLGLSTVYGIVTQSGGSIFVESGQGQGTTFTIYLPRTEPASPPGESAAFSEAGSHQLQGSETILLVEDESAVRVLARTILEHQGYAVLEASSPDEALHLAAQHHGPLHLLLTDVVMPGMGGRVLAEHLARSKPHLRVLYMSGYTDDAIVHRGVSHTHMAFLAKPFTPAALAAKVREVLDQPSRPSEGPAQPERR